MNSIEEINPITWEKLPPVEGSTSCLTCGKQHHTLDLQSRVCVGFGCAGYSRDGECLWQESGQDEYLDCPLVSSVENMAMTAPDHDWRIFFYAPLSEAVYQRQGRGHWVLVKSGLGFA